MSDSPEHPEQSTPNPLDPQAAAPIEPTPTSAAPGGLEPSPGIAPPPGMTPPEVSLPETPEFQAPQFQDPTQPFPQDPTQQFQAPEAPQFQDPTQQFQDPSQPFAQQSAAPQYGQPPVDPQFAQDPAQQQFMPAAGGPAAPKKGLSTGAIIGIVGGSIALVVLLIVGGIMAMGALSGGSDASDKASSSSEKPVKTPKTATGTVELFLNSVADGDATTARKLAGGASSDELLTSEALAASLKVSPITNIVVDEDANEPDDFQATVTATFDVGDTPVTRDFKLWKASNSWEISDGLVSFSLDSFDGLDPAVNGIAVSGGSSMKAFPGAYQVTLGLDKFELDGSTDTFVLASRNDSEVFYKLKPKLTEAATEEYRTLVTASLKSCIESKTFTTPCGLEVSQELNGGEKVIDGTITRTLDTEAEAKLKRLKPESSYSAPTVVSTYDYITVTTTAEVDNAGARETGTLYGGGSMLTPTVDFAADEPTVSWE